MWRFFIDNFKFTILIIITLIFLGTLSIIQIPKESQPDIEIPIIIVSTSLSGAGAEDMELLITDVIEESLMTLEDVSTITSTSLREVSSIVVQFEVDENTEKKLNEVKDRVDLISRELPQDATDPIVQKIRLTDLPILNVSLAGEFSLPELKAYAEDLKNEVEKVTGVSQVQIIGGVDRQIYILIDKIKLDSYGISINDVTRGIQLANSDTPAGVIEHNETRYIINFHGRIESIEELKNIPISIQGGVPVILSDIGEVIDDFKIQTSISRLGVKAKSSLSAIALRIFKTSGGNVVDVVDRSWEKISAYKNKSLPENLIVAKTEDNAKFVREDLKNLVVNGTQTLIIVMILLFLFVGFREALLASLIIPFTFLITFIFLSIFGFTLNFMTLFSLILSLGMLVDGSIVITQGMHFHINSGATPYEAAIKTLSEFKLPLIAGTLTTVFAFLPMLLTSGIIGKYIRTIPITVTVVLMSSLFVALGIITAVGAQILKPKKKFEEEKVTKIHKLTQILISRVEISYKKVFLTLLHGKKTRRIFYLIIVLSFLGSLSLPITGLVKVEMFPQIDQESLYINYETPPGTSLEKTAFGMSLIEEVLVNDPRIETFVVNVGSLGSAGSMASFDSNKGHVLVNLKTRKDREQDSVEIINEYEKKLVHITEGVVRLTQMNNGPENTPPIEVKVAGKDFEKLESIAFEIKKLIDSIPGTKNTNTSVEPPNPELILTIDRQKAQLYGLTTQQVALALRTAINGTRAISLKQNGDSVDVVVKYNLIPYADTFESNRLRITEEIDLAILENLTITTPVSNSVPLSQFIIIQPGVSRRVISHKDAKRSITIMGYTEKGITAQQVFDELSKRLPMLDIPTSYIVSMGGEQEEIQKSFSDMFRAMILGVLMILALLVLQFNSYKQPLYIIISIPLALIAVFPGLFAVGLSLSFPGIIGIVALVGIVVNNAIILIDRINSNRLEGMQKEEAVIESSISRFEPIFLTTITTVFGILPLAIQDDSWGPLGWSIVFGLSFSTILTMFVIPLLYFEFEKEDIYTNFVK